MMKKNQQLKSLNTEAVILFLIVFCCLNSISIAQWTRTKKEMEESKSDLKSMIQVPTTNVPPLEGPVDPDKYYVGPSDILSVNIWISPPLNFSLNVTPEKNTSIIPTVGEVRITDLNIK